MSERDQQIRKMQAKVDEWSAEIDRIEARLRQLDAEQRLEVERDLAAIRRRRDEAKQRVDAAGRASKDAWSDISTGFERAAKEIGSAVRRASDRLS